MLPSAGQGLAARGSRAHTTQLSHSNSLHARVLWRGQRPSRANWRRPVNSDDELHETKLGPDVATGIKEVKEGLRWSAATVIRNECVLQGSGDTPAMPAHAWGWNGCCLMLPDTLLPAPCRAANLEGNHRLLHLSVSDHVSTSLSWRQPGLQGIAGGAAWPMHGCGCMAAAAYGALCLPGWAGTKHTWAIGYSCMCNRPLNSSAADQVLVRLHAPQPVVV